MIEKDQINELNIAASRIMALGNLLNFVGPEDFPTVGNGIYYDLGQVLVDSGKIIEGVATELERRNLRQN